MKTRQFQDLPMKTRNVHIPSEIRLEIKTAYMRNLMSRTIAIERKRARQKLVHNCERHAKGIYHSRSIKPEGHLITLTQCFLPASTTIINLATLPPGASSLSARVNGTHSRTLPFLCSCCVHNSFFDVRS